MRFSIPADEADRRLEVHVSAIRSGDVVEFTFVYGDPDLAVELILPSSAFREFCHENGCFVSVADERLRAPVLAIVGPSEVALVIPAGYMEVQL